MGEIGFVLLVLVVLVLPVWASRGIRNRLKERMAPVPARSTTVVLQDSPVQSSPPLPSMLSQVVIRTGHGGGRRHLYAQASGAGMDDSVQDTHDASAGPSNGHGDGL
jgi:hypothetical protein